MGSRSKSSAASRFVTAISDKSRIVRMTEGILALPDSVFIEILLT